MEHPMSTDPPRAGYYIVGVRYPNGVETTEIVLFSQAIRRFVGKGRWPGWGHFGEPYHYDHQYWDSKTKTYVEGRPEYTGWRHTLYKGDE